MCRINEQNPLTGCCTAFAVHSKGLSLLENNLSWIMCVYVHRRGLFELLKKLQVVVFENKWALGFKGVFLLSIVTAP